MRELNRRIGAVRVKLSTARTIEERCWKALQAHADTLDDIQTDVAALEEKHAVALQALSIIGNLVGSPMTEDLREDIKSLTEALKGITS